jgi:hypothetical protein
VGFGDQAITLVLFEILGEIHQQFGMHGVREAHRQVGALSQCISAETEDGLGLRTEVADRPGQRMLIQPAGGAYRRTRRGGHATQHAIIHAGSATEQQVTLFGEMDVANRRFAAIFRAMKGKHMDRKIRSLGAISPLEDRIGQRLAGIDQSHRNEILDAHQFRGAGLCTPWGTWPLATC